MKDIISIIMSFNLSNEDMFWLAVLLYCWELQKQYIGP